VVVRVDLDVDVVGVPRTGLRYLLQRVRGRTAELAPAIDRGREQHEGGAVSGDRGGDRVPVELGVRNRGATLGAGVDRRWIDVGAHREVLGWKGALARRGQDRLRADLELRGEGLMRAVDVEADVGLPDPCGIERPVEFVDATSRARVGELRGARVRSGPGGADVVRLPLQRCPRTTLEGSELEVDRSR